MSRTERPWLAWILVTTGGVAVALATLEASSGASEANGKRQEAVRAQTGYTAATVSNIRKVYVDEAPLALAINAGLIRAEELERRAGPRESALHVQARAERAAADEYLRRFRAAQGPINELVATSRYQPGSGAGAPQLGQRLAALQVENGELAGVVRESLAAADRAERRVTRAGWGTGAGAAVTLIGFGLWWWQRRESPASEPAETPSAPAPRSGPVPASADQTASTDAPVSAGLLTSLGPPATPGSPAAGVPLLIAVAGVAAIGFRAHSRRVLALLIGTAFGFVLRDVLASVPIRPAAQVTAPKQATQTAAAPPPEDPPATDELPEIAFTAPDLPAVPPDEPPTAPKWSPLPAIMFGLAAAVVTAGQIQASVAESRLLGDAARRADMVAGAVTGGLIRKTFIDNGKQTGLMLGQRADDLAEAGGDPKQAAADNAASARIIRLTADIGAQPFANEGLDSFTQTVVSGLQGEVMSMRADQERAAAAAENAGKQSDSLVVVLFALTLAASLVEISRSLTTGTTRATGQGAGRRRLPRPDSAVRYTGYAVGGAAVLYALAIISFN